MEQNIPISFILENALKETREAVENVRKKYSLRPCIMDVVISEVLADVRNSAKDEFISAANEMLAKKYEELEKVNEELNKAKAAAKKVLKDEPERVSESDTDQHREEVKAWQH